MKAMKMMAVAAMILGMVAAADAGLHVATHDTYINRDYLNPKQNANYGAGNRLQTRTGYPNHTLAKFDLTGENESLHSVEKGLGEPLKERT